MLSEAAAKQLNKNHIDAYRVLFPKNMDANEYALQVTPAQKSLNPPPEPVDSILGVLKRVVLPNLSATTVAKGYTVDDPTILI